MLCLWTSAGVDSQVASFQHTSGALEAQLGHSNLDGSSPFIMTNLEGFVILRILDFWSESELFGGWCGWTPGPLEW